MKEFFIAYWALLQSPFIASVFLLVVFGLGLMCYLEWKESRSQRD